MTHELKIAPQYFEAVLAGYKTFEIRLNDRDYQKGDMVILREYFSENEFPYGYSGRAAQFTIGDVSQFAQKEGWCVFSLIKEKSG